ncbi:MAG TPA: TonB-dependent receptor [Pseudomonas xinjiangensis]|uniref:TonB-dependent receptor n=2 Tax=root TaxID=1 RepID=A0A7V1BR56_9GAMM|nr:TonB-dependent receptor [Halopseudomonas xinjiangensis]HEC48865.1 TonB-dependent receptor [Halopseudomonas xinjiangensis]
MQVSRFALAIAITTSLPAVANSTAGPTSHALPDMLVTSARHPEPRQQATAANTVFTRADIERLQPLDLPDLLARAPGVHIARNGGPGTLSSLFIRGTASSQTLILVDGQRIADASSGLARLEHLHLDHIEKVEVIRGGRSALYGSDAIGGVIQIFTRRTTTEGLAPRVTLGVGSHGNWQRSIGVAGGNENTRFDLGASLDETEGFSRTTLPDSDDSAYRNKAVNLSITHRFNETLQGGVALLRQSGETEYDFSLSPAAFASTDFEVSTASVFAHAKLNEIWSSRLEAGHSEDRQTTADPFGGSVFNTYRDQLNWTNHLTMGNGHELTAGADWYEDHLNSSEDFTRTSRWNRAVFAQHQYDNEQFGTELGLRHDSNQQFGNQNSWNAAFKWHFDSRNDIILSYSEAFRAPTFNDLYYPDSCFPGFGCTIYANPDLSPETARSYELQWRSNLTDTTRLETALYRTDLRDAIVTNNALDGNQAGNLNPFRPENIDRARIYGFEAAVHQRLMSWDASVSYSHTDARNRSGGANDGNRLARRPANRLNLDIDRSFDAFSVGASWLVVGQTYDDLNNENRIPGYGVVDVRASWQVQDDVKLNLSVENLLARDYYQARGTAFDAETFDEVPFRYREGGRIALLSVTWTPKI